MTVGDPSYVDALTGHRGLLIYQAALGLPLALCLLTLATLDGPVARFFAAWRGAASFSYMLYVIHLPVMTLIFSVRASHGSVPGAAGTEPPVAAAIMATEAVSFLAARRRATAPLSCLAVLRLGRDGAKLTLPP